MNSRFKASKDGKDCYYFVQMTGKETIGSASVDSQSASVCSVSIQKSTSGIDVVFIEFLADSYPKCGDLSPVTPENPGQQDPGNAIDKKNTVALKVNVEGADVYLDDDFSVGLINFDLAKESSNEVSKGTTVVGKYVSVTDLRIKTSSDNSDGAYCKPPVMGHLAVSPTTIICKLFIKKQGYKKCIVAVSIPHDVFGEISGFQVVEVLDEAPDYGCEAKVVNSDTRQLEVTMTLKGT